MSLPAKVRRVANSDFQIQENAFGSIPNQITRNADARSPTANETQNGTNAQPGIMDDQIVIDVPSHKIYLRFKFPVQKSIEATQIQIS